MTRFQTTHRSVSATRLHDSEIAPVAAANSRLRLPRTALVQPGAYRVGDGSFALDEPGAYRFEDGDGGVIEQRVVPATSLDDLLTDLSWLWGYGSAHDSLSARERLRLALHSRVSATCTPLSSDLTSILDGAGFRARVVLIFTRQELNDEDNGHTLLEVASDDGWAAYDPSFRTFFRRGGRRLSLSGLCDAVPQGDYEIEPLAGGAPPLGAFAQESGGLQERMERLVASEQERRRWYERVAGVPLIRTGGGSFVFSADEPLASVLAAYSASYRPIDPREFRALSVEKPPAP